MSESTPASSEVTKKYLIKYLILIKINSIKDNFVLSNYILKIFLII